MKLILYNKGMNTTTSTTIKATNLEITEAIREYVDKRFEKVHQFLADDTTARVNVEIAKTSNHHKHGDIFRSDVRVSARGQQIYAQSEESDLYTTIDIVRDEVLRQLTTSKDKRTSLLRRGGAKVKGMLRRFI